MGSSQKEDSEKLDSSLIKGESLSYSTMCSAFFSSSFHIFSLPFVFNSLIIRNSLLISLTELLAFVSLRKDSAPFSLSSHLGTPVTQC